jgi:hypothetical protein
MYANFLRQEATKRLDERSFVYGRKTERDFKERIKEHSQGTEEARPREKARIILCFAFVEILFMTGSLSSQYTAKTHPAVYELVEGFTIVTLGPYESRAFLDLTSQLQLAVVADRCDRHLSLGLNRDSGMMPWGAFLLLLKKLRSSSISLFVTKPSTWLCGPTTNLWFKDWFTSFDFLLVLANSDTL